MRQTRHSDLPRKQLQALAFNLFDVLLAFWQQDQDFRRLLNGQLIKISYLWVEMVSFVCALVQSCAWESAKTTVSRTTTN
jgi:hypothetical protein